MSAVTNVLLFVMACILGVGFLAVLSLLAEIRDALLDACTCMQRVADALEEEDEPSGDWTLVAPPIGYRSGRGPR